MIEKYVGKRYTPYTMIIFLYGPDDFRARQKIAQLRDKFIKDIDPTGSSVLAVDGAKTTLDELSDAYRPQSLFAKRRFIVLTNPLANKDKEFIEALTDFISEQKKNENILVVYESSFTEKKTGAKVSIMKPSGDDKLVALNKAEKKLFDRLGKADFVQAFQMLTPAQLTKTLAELAGKRGAALSAAAATTLVRLIGMDLWPLSQEIEKLSAYALARDGEKATITDADVRELVSQSITDNIFALTDALGNKQTAVALKLLADQVNAGTNANYLLTMMLWQFKTLASVRQALDSGGAGRELASQLGLHPYVLEKSINQVRKFSFETLERIINTLIELDYKQKTGQGSLEELLPVAIARL